MWKLIPILGLWAVSFSCHQDTAKQERWPGTDNSAHNQNSGSTKVEPGTPASESTEPQKVQPQGQQKDNHTENLTKPATPTPRPKAKADKKPQGGAVYQKQDRYRMKRFPWTGQHYLRTSTAAATKKKNRTEITPFIVKKAAFNLLRSS